MVGAAASTVDAIAPFPDPCRVEARGGGGDCIVCSGRWRQEAAGGGGNGRGRSPLGAVTGIHEPCGRPQKATEAWKKVRIRTLPGVRQHPSVEDHPTLDALERASDRTLVAQQGTLGGGACFSRLVVAHERLKDQTFLTKIEMNSCVRNTCRVHVHETARV